MFFLYDILFFIFSLIYLPYLVIKGKWHKDFFLRFGKFTPELQTVIQSKENIWIHAVSVGEVLAVLGLIEELKNEFAAFQIICSTTTKTGYALAQDKLKDKTVVIYAPLDFSWVVRRYIALIKPKIYIAAETELWPNLYSFLHQDGVTIVQVNGRVSEKSFKGYQRFSFLTKRILRCVNIFCMQSQLDAQRIQQIGADPKTVKVIGNLKFDHFTVEEPLKLADVGFCATDSLLIAGSTHPGEEDILLTIYKNLSKEFLDLRLVIAPRHIDRVEDIVHLIERRGFEAVKFSEINNVKLDAQKVIVIDTIGHLGRLYSLAEIVFVGKSLLGRGGQNVIEPAFFGKAIVVGPYTENFTDIINLFLQSEALIQVRDENELAKEIKDLLSNPRRRNKLGLAAKSVVDDSQGATQKTVKVICEVLVFPSPWRGGLGRGASGLESPPPSLPTQREPIGHQGVGIIKWKINLTQIKHFFYCVVTDEKKGWGINILKVFLWFLSLVYGAVLLGRSILYTKGILKQQRLPRPVISVGNISWGGTGKTPFIIYIAKQLKDEGFKPVILTRGYMGGKKNADSDEGKLLKENLKDVDIVVGANRFKMAEDFFKNNKADVFLLDDGFQHQSLWRDLDVVVIDATNPWGNGHLIPRGILREPLSALRRANLLILSKTDTGRDHLPVIKNCLNRKIIHQPIIETIHEPTALVNLKTQTLRDLSFLSEKKICSFCSIGNPDSFEVTLVNLGACLDKNFAFLDHHVYTREDIEGIIRYARENDVDIVVTTQKDAVKLNPFLSLFEGKCTVLSLNIQLTVVRGKDELLDGIHRLLLR